MHIETTLLADLIAEAGDTLIEKAANGNLDAVREVVKSDYADPAFQRGCLHGMKMVLDCEGMPAFLNGEAVKHLKIFLLVVTGKITAEHIKTALEKAL